MITLDNFKETEEYEMNRFEYGIFFTDNPSYNSGSHSKSQFILCGNVKRGGNEPYCYPQEKQCANHICRLIGKGVYQWHVIRDDATVWTIDLRNFEDVTPLDIVFA